MARGRKSTIDKLPPKARRIVERRAADPAATSDAVRAELARHVPPEQLPSSRALRRWFARRGEVVQRIKESREVARVLAQEIGEVPDGDQGRALVEILQSLVHQVTHQLASDDDRETKLSELHTLAKTIKLSNEAGAVAYNTAAKIELAARAKLLREQQEALDRIRREGGISADTEQTIKRVLLGVRT
jgi:hypothetical protein